MHYFDLLCLINLPCNSKKSHNCHTQVGWLVFDVYYWIISSFGFLLQYSSICSFQAELFGASLSIEPVSVFVTDCVVIFELNQMNHHHPSISCLVLLFTMKECLFILLQQICTILFVLGGHHYRGVFGGLSSVTSLRRPVS